MGTNSHAWVRLGHSLIQTQQVVLRICPKVPRVHLTTPSREEVLPGHHGHMRTTHLSFRSTAPHHSRSARVRLPALPLKTFPALTSCRNTTRMHLQIRTATPLVLLRPRKRSFRSKTRNRRQITEQHLRTTRVMTQCFTPTEPPTTRNTTRTSTTTSEVLRHFVRLIMALERGRHTVVLMVAAQDTPPPTRKSRGLGCSPHCLFRAGDRRLWFVRRASRKAILPWDLVAPTTLLHNTTRPYYISRGTWSPWQ